MTEVLSQEQVDYITAQVNAAGAVNNPSYTFYSTIVIRPDNPGWLNIGALLLDGRIMGGNGKLHSGDLADQNKFVVVVVNAIKDLERHI